MWLTKKILVPCDFSGSSRRACELGAELAEIFRVPLTLMHVVPLPSSIYSDVPYVTVPDYAQLVEESARSALRDEAARARRSKRQEQFAERRSLARERGGNDVRFPCPHGSACVAGFATPCSVSQWNADPGQR